MQRPGWILFGFSAAAVVAVGATVLLTPPPPEAEAQPSLPFYSYAVKFVCGFNSSNIGFSSTGAPVGEATVKIGNYATEINIYNPQRLEANLQKRVLILYRGDAAIPPIGREPATVGPSGGEGIVLPFFRATMDDCNKIYQLAGIPLANPPIPLIGFLVIQSSREIDVTGVYTAELCSDWRLSPVGAANVCTAAAGQNYGVSLSIDVEQVQGKLIN